MRPFATSLLLFLVLTSLPCAPAHAQGGASLSPGTELTPIDPARGEHALMKRRSGRDLTIMSIVHLAVGGALLVEMGVTSYQCAHRPGCMQEMGGIPEMVAGSLLVSSGAVFLTAGAPMWAIGAREARAIVSASAGGLRVRF